MSVIGVDRKWPAEGQTQLRHWDQFAWIKAEPRRWVVERTFACFGRNPSPRQRLRGSIHPQRGSLGPDRQRAAAFSAPRRTLICQTPILALPPIIATTSLPSNSG